MRQRQVISVKVCNVNREHEAALLLAACRQLIASAEARTCQSDGGAFNWAIFFLAAQLEDHFDEKLLEMFGDAVGVPWRCD